MALFENYERRVEKINAVLAEYGIKSIEECKEGDLPPSQEKFSLCPLTDS